MLCFVPFSVAESSGLKAKDSFTWRLVGERIGFAAFCQKASLSFMKVGSCLVFVHRAAPSALPFEAGVEKLALPSPVFF